MKNLSREEFLARKNRDRICIMGSGWSINGITRPRMIEIMADCDTIGFNWYCRSYRPTTFYLIREQCVAPKRCEKRNLLPDLYKYVNACKSTLIIKDKNSQHDDHRHAENLEGFTGEGVVVSDLVGVYHALNYETVDVLDEGVIHQKNTVSDVLHFAVWMGYKEIIFCGVDLNDSRYFWLKKNETRELLRKGGRTAEQPHKQKKNVLKLVREAQEQYPEITFRVENEESALAEIMEVWR